MEMTLYAATAVDDARRLLQQGLDQACGISLKAFCLLASVHSHEGALPLASFPPHVFVSGRAASLAASELAHNGLVEKSYAHAGRRNLQLRETAQASATLATGFEVAYQCLEEAAERARLLEGVEGMAKALSLAAGRLGVSELEFDPCCHALLTPACLIALMGLIQRWDQEGQPATSLTFTEAQCLVLLKLHRIATSFEFMADILRVEPAEVSKMVARLRNKFFAGFSAGYFGDSYSQKVGLTPQGAEMALTSAEELGKVVANLRSGSGALLAYTKEPR